MPAFPHPDLTVEQLTLSDLTSDDAPALVSAFSDPELRRWLPLPSPYTLQMGEAWCAEISEQMRREGRGLVIGIRRDGMLAGSIDAKRVDWRAGTLELSYWTAPLHRGQGLMSAALRRTTDWLIEGLGFERVELRISPGNTGSLATARAAGFTREGVARNAGFTDTGRTDLVIWSRVPMDYPSSSASP
ncbi:GNAT family N-acetyltransferase [Microbacterium esteraromaticum]|uniref:GNAT family N-acetyltransferase n=1 Tax=Microbacterium esteraromaticum TaxID=57043 RepID=UPI00195647D9|nr:GNAT family N-acetyltransferase [Microbacterium esteraromaticum]MBM7464498.1 RimJ/RimL family protein N-acetyltransferase [Microbacterium esteraromaticum]